jgi:hypothetical protein
MGLYCKAPQIRKLQEIDRFRSKLVSSSLDKHASLNKHTRLGKQTLKAESCEGLHFLRLQPCLQILD